MASTSSPYATPLKAQVLGIGPIKDFIASNGEARQFIQLGLATQQQAIKAFHYNPEKLKTIKENNFVIIKNFNTRQDGNITLNAFSLIYKCSSFEIPQTIKDIARQFVYPPEANLVTIREASSSPVKTMVSLKGFITQDENVREVNVGGRPTPVRGMTLEDTTAKIKVSLWRGNTSSPVKIGDYIHVTNLTITRFNNESTAGTTTQTKIEILQPPQEQKNITVEGFLQADENNWELITEDGKSLTVDKTTLSTHLKTEPSNLEDALACLVPWNIDAVMTGIHINSFPSPNA